MDDAAKPETEEQAATPDADSLSEGIAGEKDAENLGADIDRTLNEAEDGLNAATRDALDGEESKEQPAAESAVPFQLQELAAGVRAGSHGSPLEILGDVEMDLRIELGRTQLRLEEVLHLRDGSVVALDKLAGDPVDVFANGRLIARGEVLVMNENFCVRVTELVGAAS